MSDLSEDDRKHNKNEKKKYEILQEKFNDLTWQQRKIPYFAINPCLKSFEEIGEIMFDLYDNGKIKKLIIEHGDGDVLPENASVYLHYTFYLEGTDEPFDSTLHRSVRPKHYQMGGGYLVSGFEIGLSSMKENEVAQFLIHPKYGYGKLGCPPRIPGNAYLMLVIYVTGFIDCGIVTLERPRRDLNTCTFSERVKIAKSHSALAIDNYKHGRVKAACHHFEQSQYCLTEVDKESEETERHALLQKSIVNQMMCLSHQKYFKPDKILKIFQYLKSNEKQVLNLLENNAKYHYCMGVAYTYQQNYKDAADSFRKAQSLSPFLPRLSQAVRTLNEKAGNSIKQEKVMWEDAFKKLGYSPVINKIVPESEEMAELRNYISGMLSKCSEKDFNVMNLGSGFNKDERRILAEEADKLGLICNQKFVDNSMICIEITKPGNSSC